MREIVLGILLCHCTLRVLSVWLYFPFLSFGLGKAVMTDKGSLCLVSLGVEGMTCNSCVQSIEQRIGSFAGVIDVKVYVV